MIKKLFKFCFFPYWKLTRKERFIRSFFTIALGLIAVYLLWKFPVPAYEGFESILTIILIAGIILQIGFDYFRYKQEIK